MRSILQFFIIACLVLIAAVSCIDEYSLPDTDTEPMVVIFGQIVSESDCVFTLRSTIRPTGELDIYSYIDDAKVTVRGTDGQVFEGHGEGGFTGRFIVHVGTLASDQKYHVEVSTKYGDFESKPMLPLDAPELTELYYEQPGPDNTINVMLSTQDPQELVYLLWQVDEYYEIRTPFTTQWEYRIDPDEELSGNPRGSFVMLDPQEYTNHGWRHATDLSNFATNQDYACGAITRRCIFTRANSDPRLQTRCCVRIKQMSITRQEYEYRRLMLLQSSEVGGLFTQMPSELPTNIRSLGERKAIGYIGVRGYAGQKEMYINGSDIGYHSKDNPLTIDKEHVMEPIQMVNMGYRVYSYNSDKDEAVWTYQWCVDYHSIHWGGFEAIEKPDFWKDK